MKIIGFVHICMVHHYKEIITEQLNLLLESGLYEQSENIFVGCLGEPIDEVMALFKPHKKIKVLSHSQDLKQYEFLTLRILHDKAKSEKPFYGYYFHTKGVSYPNPPHREGGDYWRDYMNHYVITRWKDNVQKLDEGFQTSGVKFIKDGFPPHYSGNFFWFKSEYAKTLAPIERLNPKDRYSAEMWLCSNYPKVANLCDLFVDYKTRGKFNPDEVKSKPKEVVLEKPKPEVKVQPEVVVEPPKVRSVRFADIVKDYDQNAPHTKDIVKKLDRFQDVAEEVIDDFYRFKNCNVQQLFINLSRLLLDSSAYYIRKK